MYSVEAVYTGVYRVHVAGANNFKWDSTTTRLLIKCYEDYEDEFENNVTRATISWANVSKLMHAYGYPVTSTQCKTKWCALKRKFTAIKMHNSKTGNAPEKWEFFDRMNNILGSKPENNPVAIASNLKGIKNKSKEPPYDEVEEHEDDEDEEDIKLSKKVIKKVRTSQNQAILESVTNRIDRRKDRPKERLLNLMEQSLQQRQKEFEATQEMRKQYLEYKKQKLEVLQKPH